MSADTKLPQDVDEFIQRQEDLYGRVVYEDLRAWMTGHVRVPVEFVDDAMCRTCYTHAAYMTNPCQWCKDREAMLNASKEE